MLQTKVTLAKLTTDLVAIQALKWQEDLHPRGADGKFGSKEAGAETAGADLKPSLQEKALRALPKQAQTYARRLLKQPNPQAAAQQIVDSAKANPGTVATVALTAALLVVGGVNPKAVKEFMKLTKEAFEVGKQAAKAEAKTSAKGAEKVAEAKAKVKPGIKGLPKMESAKDVIMKSIHLAGGVFGDVRKNTKENIVYKLFKDAPYAIGGGKVYSKKNEVVFSHLAGELGIGPRVLSHSDEGYSMEYLADHATMRSKLTDVGAKEPQEAVVLLRKLVDQVSVLHREGIAHRDLHFANAMVGPDGSVRVIDYGLAIGKQAKVPRLAKLDPLREHDLSTAMSKDVEMILIDAANSVVNAHAVRMNRVFDKQGMASPQRSTIMNAVAEKLRKDALRAARIGSGNLSDPEVAKRVKQAISQELFYPDKLDTLFNTEMQMRGYRNAQLHAVQAAKDKEKKMSAVAQLMAKRKQLQRQYLEKPSDDLQKQIEALQAQIAFSDQPATIDDAYAMMAH